MRAVTAANEGERRLGWGQLAIFSLPVLLVQAIEIPWRVYLPAFLTGTLGFPLAAIGTLLAAVRLFDTGLDLFVGWASDRWPTRFGRRKPWMAAGVPLILLGATQIFLARGGLSLPMLVVWSLLLHAGYTMVVTPHGGWGLEMGRTPAARLRVIAAKTWFGALAMPLVVLLPTILERLVAADRTLQLRTMGLTLLVIAPAIILLVLLTISEPATRQATPQPRPHLLRGLASVVRQPEFARIAILYTLAGLSEATSSGAFIFFVEGPLGLRGWASTLLLIQAGIAVTALPLWTMLGDRIGKSRALIAALAVQATATALMLVVPKGATGFSLALLAIRYACWGADFLFLRAMVADMAGRSIDRGQNQSATYYAAFNVTLRLSMSIGAGLVLWIPALLGAKIGDGALFDGAIRLTFILPCCLSAICSVALLGWRAFGAAGRFSPRTLARA